MKLSCWTFLPCVVSLACLFQQTWHSNTSQYVYEHYPWKLNFDIWFSWKNFDGVLKPLTQKSKDRIKPLTISDFHQIWCKQQWQCMRTLVCKVKWERNWYDNYCKVQTFEGYLTIHQHSKDRTFEWESRWTEQTSSRTKSNFFLFVNQFHPKK